MSSPFLKPKRELLYGETVSEIAVEIEKVDYGFRVVFEASIACGRSSAASVDSYGDEAALWAERRFKWESDARAWAYHWRDQLLKCERWAADGEEPEDHGPTYDEVVERNASTLPGGDRI